MASPSDKVLSYLTSQNRPYSVNDIFLNLHREVGKAAVQKALDILVADEKVREKVGPPLRGVGSSLMLPSFLGNSYQQYTTAQTRGFG